MASAFLFGDAGADVPLRPVPRRLTQFRLAIHGLQATIDPLAPLVPKGVASGVRIIVRAGGQDLSLEQARGALGPGFSVHAELAGPSLSQTVTLPMDGTFQGRSCKRLIEASVIPARQRARLCV